jgi:hypothetical protein
MAVFESQSLIWSDALVISTGCLSLVLSAGFSLATVNRRSRSYLARHSALHAILFSNSMPLWIISLFGFIIILLPPVGFHVVFDPITEVCVGLILVGILICSLTRGIVTSPVPSARWVKSLSHMLDVSTLLLGIGLLTYAVNNAKAEMALIVSLAASLTLLVGIMLETREFTLLQRLSVPISAVLTTSGLGIFLLFQSLFLHSALYTTWWLLVAVALLVVYLRRQKNYILFLGTLTFGGALLRLIAALLTDLLVSQSVEIVTAINLLFFGLILAASGYHLVSEGGNIED